MFILSTLHLRRWDNFYNDTFEYEATAELRDARGAIKARTSADHIDFDHSGVAQSLAMQMILKGLAGASLNPDAVNIDAEVGFLKDEILTGLIRLMRTDNMTASEARSRMTLGVIRPGAPIPFDASGDVEIIPSLINQMLERVNRAMAAALGVDLDALGGAPKDKRFKSYKPSKFKLSNAPIIKEVMPALMSIPKEDLEARVMACIESRKSGDA